MGHPIPSTNVETRPKLTLGTCQKLAGGSGGGGNFIFGFGNEMTHPCNGSEIANPPLDLGLKYHDPPPLV